MLSIVKKLAIFEHKEYNLILLIGLLELVVFTENLALVCVIFSKKCFQLI